MSETAAIIDLLDDPATIESDMLAVQHFSKTGKLPAPDVIARIRARSERATQEYAESRGAIDIQQFLHSVDEEE